MSDNISRALLYLTASAVREAVTNWERTLLAGLIIKEFGASGARFVGYVGYEVAKSNIEMTFRIGKRFGQTIGPEILSRTGVPRALGMVRIALPASIATVAVGVGAYSLAKAPQISYDFFSDTDNYGTDTEGNLYTHPLILQGAVTN